MDATAYAKVFASPHAGSSEEVVRKVAGARLRRVRRAVARALVDAAEVTAAAALLAFTEGTGSAWRPETGLSWLAYRSQSAAGGALQLAIAIAGSGGQGSLEVRVESPVSLHLDGWVVTVEGACAVSADGRTVVIRSDRGRSLFIAADRCWVMTEENPGGAWRSQPSGARAPRYVTATGFCGSVERFPWLAAKPQPAPIGPMLETSTAVASLRGGWQLIAEKVPLYSAWVMSTAVGCSLLAPSGRGHQSASSSDHPGLLAIEPPACPVFCGEMLVHECSHQQLLAHASFAPLVNAGTEETCYSPLKHSPRPLLNVLFGGHAVGNMILYYAELQRNMELDEASRGRFKAQCTWFAEDYRLALDQSQSLTRTGRLLWRQLCDVVDERVAAVRR
jgi:HEXXH motif-containing protein